MAKALTTVAVAPRTPQRAPLCALEQRASLVLHRLMKHLDLNDAKVARSVGISRSTVQGKRSGTVRITIDELEAFAEALHVEPFVFFLEPDDAVRWALDHLPAADQRGMADLPLVITVLASAIAAWAGVKFPEFAMWAAENQRTDEVMSDSTGRDRPLTLCPVPPTMSAKSVCRPRTHRPSRPDHRLCIRREWSDAVECVDPR